MQRLLDSELRPGERLFWSQQPRPGALAQKSCLSFLIGIPFFAFAVSWTIAASSALGVSKAGGSAFPSIFPMLWGSVFILLGVSLLMSPVWAFWKALHTVYAITDQRAILIAAPWRRAVYSFAGQQLVDIHRVEDGRGRGDIVFHREARVVRYEKTYQVRRGGNYYYDIGFLGIERIREAEDFLGEVYAKSRTA